PKPSSSTPASRTRVSGVGRIVSMKRASLRRRERSETRSASFTARDGTAWGGAACGNRSGRIVTHSSHVRRGRAGRVEGQSLDSGCDGPGGFGRVAPPAGVGSGGSGGRRRLPPRAVPPSPHERRRGLARGAARRRGRRGVAAVERNGANPRDERAGVR